MAIAMADHGVQGVSAFGEILGEMIKRAEQVKKTTTVEPALVKSDFTDILARLNSRFQLSVQTLEAKKRTHTIFDQAFRDRFNVFLVSIDRERKTKTNISDDP